MNKLSLRAFKEVPLEKGGKESKSIFDGVRNGPVAETDVVELRKKPRVVVLGSCNFLLYIDVGFSTDLSRTGVR
jgi:hypothetical protein